MRIRYTIILLVSLLLYPTISKATIPDSVFIKALQKQDTSLIHQYISENPNCINATIGKKQTTPLVMSIYFRNKEITKLLIEKYHVDIELQCHELTPLMHAASIGNVEIIKLLIECGSEIDAENAEKNTAFIYASMSKRLEALQVLYKAGVGINHTNLNGFSALDYSLRNNSKEIATYLKSIGLKTFPKNISSCVDGPHFKYHENGHIESMYLKHDSVSGQTELVSKKFPLKKSRIVKTNFENENRSYLIPEKFEAEPAIYNDVKKIFAIGDIHGQHDRMIKMLKHAGVINDSLLWNFGGGHVVFIGDIFDRGEKVTEALWFIYQLEQDAEKQGGRVHLLLGNHEVMVMRNDLRYVADKYYSLTSNLNIEYRDLYTNQTVIGRWLLSKNSVVRINDVLFTHAGLSPQIYKQKLSIDTINAVMYSVLTKSENYPKDLEYLIRKSYGPTWYRGYFEESGKYKIISDEQLSEVLSYYKSATVVVGHTEFNTVRTHHNIKVISINIPLWRNDIPEQALLIKKGKYYKLSTKGKAQRIK